MPQASHPFANGKGNVMVSEFFGSIARFVFIIMLFAVTAWGIIQFADDVPNEKHINSAVLFGMSLCFVLHAKPLIEDLRYYFKKSVSALTNEDRKGKE
jgi:hypothetical protein